MTRSLSAILLATVFLLPASGQENPPAAAAKAPEAVTFAEHIAPIVFNNCTSCHRPGEAGPFPLMSYADVRKRGRTIERVTTKRYMPPWHPEPGHGDFLDERRLSDAQVALIKRWVDADMPEGDPAKLPALPRFTDGWHLGKPDLVVAMAKAYEVPAGGPDIYRNFVLPLNLPEDKWVTAIELRPAARSVVHHSLFFLDSTGKARNLDGKDGKPGFRGMGGIGRSGSLGGWAVGGTPQHLPNGLAMPLPKKSDLILSTHFHPSGKMEHEKTTVGLYFAKQKPSRTLVGFQAPPLFGMLTGLNIPAGARDYKVRGSFTAPVDMELVDVGGHAHYLCQTMKATAKLPDGTSKSLFSVPRWDFNWQGRYTYREAVKLPKGTVISVELSYDNSADNPNNPRTPPRRVSWGPQSTDEMGSILFSAVAARETDLPALRSGVRKQTFRLGGAGSK